MLLNIATERLNADLFSSAFSPFRQIQFMPVSRQNFVRTVRP